MLRLASFAFALTSDAVRVTTQTRTTRLNNPAKLEQKIEKVNSESEALNQELSADFLTDLEQYWERIKKLASEVNDQFPTRYHIDLEKLEQPYTDVISVLPEKELSALGDLQAFNSRLTGQLTHREGVPKLVVDLVESLGACSDRVSEEMTRLETEELEKERIEELKKEELKKEGLKEEEIEERIEELKKEGLKEEEIEERIEEELKKKEGGKKD